MKLFNRILAALLAALMLCGAWTAGAETELELSVEANTEAAAPEIDPEGIEIESDDDFAPDGDLALDGLELPALEPEISLDVDEMLLDGVEAQEAAPVQANDADSDFVIEDGVLKKYKGSGGDVVIPDGVTVIGNKAFYECESLTSVTMPDSVTEIRDGYNYIGAFSGCTDLRSVSVSKSLTHIGDYAFWCCFDLNDITLPNSLTSIGDHAFGGCDSLTNVIIPDSVTSIGRFAFCLCDNLTIVTIGNGVTGIGYHAFWKCGSLENVTILAVTINIDDTAFEDSHPTFHIISGSDAIEWADNNDYSYDIIDGISKKTLTLNVGETDTLGVYNSGKKATNVTWTSSDTAIATVKDGNVTAVKDGKCTITAALSDGTTFTCSVTVKDGAAISDSTLSLFIGETYELTIDGLAGRAVTWSSSNKNVATVKSGTVKAIKAGKCTITAKVKNGKTLKCSLTVTDGAKLSKTRLSLDAGKTATLTVSNLAGRKVTWSSSNKNVATVKAGTVTATGGGKCTITAKVANGKTLTCAVTVTDRAKLYKYDSESKYYDWDYDYSSVSEYYEEECTPIKSASLDIGQTLQLIVTYTAGRKVIWSSSNTRVATVEKGKVTPTGGGKCSITAKVGGKALKCRITVTDTARLSETTLTLNAGDTHKLTIDKLAGRAVTWSSSNKKVATVKDGVVTAVYMGKCTVTAKVKNGKTYTCKVTVTDPAALSAEKLTISTIDSAKIMLTGGLKRKVTWSTTDANVVKITRSDDGSATIKAVKTGSATITAKVEGGKTLKCAVTVVNPLSITEDWDDDYDDLASWEVGVKFTNRSNKKIIYVTFDILQYNNRGDRLESPYDYYYFNNDIDPHSSRWDDYTVNDDTRSVKFKITEVTFADKTTWKP